MSDESAYEADPGGVSFIDKTGEDREERIYERARNATTQALKLTREQLRALRKQREEINAEIRLLVDEEGLLERMVRVRKGGS